MTNRSRRRGGFTLVELACTTLLMGLLGLLVAAAWSAFAAPAVEVYGRARVAQEAALAAAALAADLGGTLASPGARLGDRDLGRLVGWRSLGGDLELCFDGDPADGIAAFALPDTLVVYQVSSRRLVRWQQDAGPPAVVAGDVLAMAVDPDPDGTGRLLRVELAFRHRAITRSYRFEATRP